MKQLLHLLTFICIGFYSSGQNIGKVLGNIKDGGNQKTIDAATISLLRSKDSSIAKVSISDKAGNFLFETIKQGSYLVQATSIGHGKAYSSIFTISEANPTFNVGLLLLVPIDKSLKEVTITSKKLLIERKIDRTVVNVDAAISNEGSTALEVLEKSPGVTVDKDGNISLKGKQGVMVMLDGKPSYLTGPELANMLRSMPSSNLDQIEIMTNPSAKYDAAGNSGIINIKTKKNKQKGFNGSVNLAYGQGVFEKTNNSLNLNYRNGKFNIFGNISGNYRENFNTLTIRRKYKNEDQSLNAIFEQTSNEMRFNNNYNAKIGADFYATKKTTFGFVVTGFTTPSNQVANNTSYLKSNTGVIDSIVTAASSEKSSWKNGAVNLNFRHQFDSTGREISADFDYLTYNSHKDQNFTNTSYTPDWITKNQDKLMGELPSLINIYTGKIDYTHPLKNGLKIESGLKTSFVETDNTAGYYNIIGGAKMADYEKTNQFVYKENINAAYLNMNKQIKKWGLQGGLRLENTNYNGRQFGNPQRQDSAFKKSYTGLFPTMFVSYAASEKNQFGFSYGRRINRPDYEDLNPFLFFLDKYTYGSGNPFLKPSYAHTFELSHTFRQLFTTTINYSDTKDLFSETFEQKGYATIVKQGNFGSAKNASISENAQIGVTKWWTSIIYSEYNYSHYTGLLNGENINIKAGNFLVNVNNQFKLKKGWSAELSGFYRTSGIEGQIIIRPMGQLNAGVQKQILKNKGTLKLNVRDMLYTMTATGDIKFQRTEAYFRNKRDSRIATISFGYRFGKPIKGVEKRKTGGAGTEQNRVKGGN
ncbi:MAG: outer membrane beta-barrel protein [Ferruginibacter sp.]